MEPLASLTGLAPGPAPLAMSPAADVDRDSPSLRARGKERSVQLLPDKVDESETPPASQRGRAADDAESPEDEIQRRRDEASESGARLAPELPEHTVAYRLHPDLLQSIQSELIDRETEETIREIPSDARLALARRFQQYITTPAGGQLDILA